MGVGKQRVGQATVVAPHDSWRLSLVRIAGGLAAVMFVCSRLLAHDGTQESSPVGLWVAEDPDGGPVRSIVELREEGGRLYGVIAKLIDEDGREVHRICRQCDLSLEGKPITGSVFLKDLVPKADRWIGGTVYDLRPGWKFSTVANCELYVRDGKLHFIGKKWGFSREMIWTRYAP